MANFLGNDVASSKGKIEIFCCSLDPVLELSRNQNFSKVGTGTATNHYGATTLPATLFFRMAYKFFAPHAVR